MAFGLLVENEYGRLQIDDQHQVVSLMLKGTAVADGNVMGSSTTRLYTLTVTGRTAPLLAVGVDKPASGEKLCQVLSAVPTGSTWTFTILVWHQHGTDFGFRWYVYDVPLGTTVPSYGLAIWNAAGQLVFNSDHPPMRIASAMVAGRTYAALNYGPLIYSENVIWDTIEQQDVIYWQLYADGVATYHGASPASGFIASGEGFSPPTIPFPHNISGSPLIAILVDVTGL